MEKEELNLTAGDIKRLKKQLLPIMIFSVFAVGIFAAIFGTVFQSDGSSGPDDFIMIPFVIFAVFFAAIIGYMTYAVVIDIRKGIKTKVSGTITDKRLNIQSKSRSGTSRSSGSGSTRSYFIYIDHEEFKVGYADYSKVRVGDYIELEQAPKSKVTLSLEVVESEEPIDDTPNEDANQVFIETKMQDVAFSAEDQTALKRAFSKEIKRKVLWTVPFLYIVFSLVSSGYQGFLVFLFPVVIIPCVQFYRLVRRISVYFKDKNYGQKEGIPAVIEDKLTVTSNRASNKSTVRTTWQSIQVDPQLYDLLTPGDKVIFFKSKFHDKPLSIVASDGEERYLV